MAYLGKTPSQAVRSRFYFTASGGETSLAPAQVTGLSFTDANYVDVSLNGVALVSGTDYTATPSTNTISSLSALTASDVVEIVVYDVFSVFGGNVNGDFTISNGTLAAEAVTVTGLTTTGNINFGDNDKAIFGAGSDLQIYHDGSNSYVKDVGTGDLTIAGTNLQIRSSSTNENFIYCVENGAVNLYHNDSQKLATTSTGVDVTGVITTDGMTTSADINFGDNDKAIFGAGSDLNVWHNGSHSYVQDTGTGNLYLAGSNVIISNPTATETMAYFDDDGGASLWYNNAVKIATTNTGVDVTGRVIATGFVEAEGGNAPSGGFQIKDTGGTARPRITNDASNATVIRAGSATGNVKFNNFANTTELVHITDGGSVGINTSSPAGVLDVRTGGTQQVIIGNSGTYTGSEYGELLFKEQNTELARVKWNPSGNTFQLINNIAGPMTFATNNTERLRVDASGLVGIGTSSPEGLIGLPATASNTPKFRLQSASTNTDFAISSYADANGTYVSLGANHYLDSGGNDAVFETTDKSAYVLLDARNNGMVSFGTNSSGVAAERMRITSGGNVGISETNPSFKLSLHSGTSIGLADLSDYSTKGILGNIHPSISSQSLGSTSVDDVRNLGFGSTYTTSASGTKPSSYGTIRVFEHYNGNLNKGARYISQVAVGHSNTPVWYARNSDTTVGTSYSAWYQFDMTSTSDERSKENVEDAPDQLAVVKQFQVKEFDYIDNADEPRQLGMMAQHVDTFAPEYVTKDAEDPNIMWRIKYNKMIPMLVKALQEATTKIETLEAKVAALENAE